MIANSIHHTDPLLSVLQGDPDEKQLRAVAAHLGIRVAPDASEAQIRSAIAQEVAARSQTPGMGTFQPTY